MAINLVHGTIETVDVTVTDVTGVVTTLDGLTPTYTVIPVDPTTDLDLGDSFLIYNAATALNSGMLMQCLIDTTIGNTVGAGPPPEWPVGKYRMYVSFNYSADIPKLGPIDLYVV